MLAGRTQIVISRWRAVALGIAVAALAYFAVYFDDARWQPTVDLAWVIAVVFWLVAFWRQETPLIPRLRQPLWFYVLYAAVLLPFATNWRWAMTADNLPWPLGGMTLAEHGPWKSFLSVYGADNFGYLQMVLHDVFMFLVAPTLFWHRVGQIGGRGPCGGLDLHCFRPSGLPPRSACSWPPVPRRPQCGSFTLTPACRSWTALPAGMPL